MRASLLLFIVLACVVLGLKVDPVARTQFRSFIAKYHKRYSAEEFHHRFQVFQDNLKRIDRLNREHEEQGYDGRFAVNEFSDLSPKEFSARKKGYKPIQLLKDDAEVMVDDGSIIAGPLPTSFDWRPKGAVSPIKNQGDCGSCWAFSTTEGVESGYFLAGNTLPILAPQQIVDCSTANEGCGGGNLPPALNYVMKTGGMETEANYPYTGADGKCKFVKSKAVATLKSWKYATKNANETAMQVASFARGPLSICVDAASWQNYNSGVIKHTCGKALDHCVQIVGWGVATPSPTSSTGSSDSSSSSGSSSTNSPSPTTSTTKLAAKQIPYWIVRNSWGTSWGLKGYLWVERGNNECGIAQEAIYPEA